MADEFAPKRAVKSQVKLKIGVQGPSGSGKTEGALALAVEILLASGKTVEEMKILLVDTENESASLYADRYPFDTIVLTSPYNPARYIKAMSVAVSGGYDLLIVDSITHEWNGEGGIMSQKDALDAKPNSNSFTNWAVLTPQHESFVEFIKQLPIDTIVTMRTKQSYVLELVKGKQRPKKLGMAPIQREGMEYEYTLVFDVDMDHKATISKNRTALFEGEEIDLRNPDVASRLIAWRRNGAEFVDKPRPIAKIDPPEVAAQGTRATKPLLIENRDRQLFWVRAKESGHSEEDIKIFLKEKLDIDSTHHIPAARLNDVMLWAKTPAVAREMSPWEEKTRGAAKILKLSQTDIQAELDLAKGDWEQVYNSISSGEDARLAAQTS